MLCPCGLCVMYIRTYSYMRCVYPTCDVHMYMQLHAMCDVHTYMQLHVMCDVHTYMQLHGMCVSYM